MKLPGFIFHNTNSRKSNLGATITYHPKTKRTLVFLHGLTIDEIKILIPKLESVKEFRAFPLVLPIILLELRLESITFHSAVMLNDIHEIEAHTGLDPRWLASNRISKITEPKRSKDVDFVSAMLDFTAITARLGYYIFFCKASVDLPDVFREILTEFLSNSPEKDQQSLKRLAALVICKNDRVQDGLKGMLSLFEGYLIRMQAERDTVS
jgi:hypothetical protein